MIQVVLNIDETQYAQLLQLLKSLNSVQLVQPVQNPLNGKQGYNFSDLSGKLEWKGNGVAEQRRLRDEW